MDKLFGIFGDVSHTKLGGGDSFTDQLSCKYTVYILSLVVILSTTRVFIDEPISCYCPTHFTGNQVEFAKKACWVRNTQYIENHEGPKYGTKKLITYYQWIPLFLTLQAVLFYTPRFIWKKLNRKSGIAVNNITDGCIDCLRKADIDESQKTIKFLAQYMDRFLVEFNKNLRSKNKLQRMKASFNGNYLVMVYLIVKILYIANVIGQIFLLNAFLGNDFHMYGIDVVSRIIQKVPWRVSHRFPRITRCELDIRVIDNVHTYKMQCVLPMNLFYEIIFIFVWFWFAFVAAATVGSFLVWMVNSLRMSIQEGYIRQRLLVLDKIKKDQKAEVSSFVKNHLRRDGCFVIRMAAKNSSDLVASELICELWDKYKGQRVKDNNRRASHISTGYEDTNAMMRKREEAAIAADEARKY